MNRKLKVIPLNKNGIFNFFNINVKIYKVTKT